MAVPVVLARELVVDAVVHIAAAVTAAAAATDARLALGGPCALLARLSREPCAEEATRSAVAAVAATP